MVQLCHHSRVQTGAHVQLLQSASRREPPAAVSSSQATTNSQSTVSTSALGLSPQVCCTGSAGLQQALSKWQFARTGEALCGETGFCCGFWTPNWWKKAFGVYDNNQAHRSMVSCSFFSSLIAALHAWCMLVCCNACGGHPP